MRIDARFLRTTLAVLAALLGTILVLDGLPEGPLVLLIAAPPLLLAGALALTPLSRPRAARVAASAAGLLAVVYVVIGIVRSVEVGAPFAVRGILLTALLLFSAAVLQVRLLGRVAPSRDAPSRARKDPSEEDPGRGTGS